MPDPVDNVVQMPLPTRSERIAALLKRETVNAADWAEIQLGLIREITEAVAEFQNDRDAFDRWLVDCGLKLSPEKRRAYEALAADIDLAREILQATDSRDIQRIERYDFRPALAIKKGFEPKVKKTGKTPKMPPAKALEAAMAAINELVAEDQPLSEEKVRRMAGVAAGTANKALAMFRARQDGEIDESQFSDKSRLTIAEAVRIHKDRLEKTFEGKVNAEVRRRIETADSFVRKHLKEVEQELSGVKRMLGQTGGVFTRAEFKQLLMCVHPDNTASASVRARITDLLIRNEARLVKAN